MMQKFILLFCFLFITGLASAKTIELTAEAKVNRILYGKKDTVEILLNRKAKLEVELEKVNATIARLNTWIIAHEK